VLCLRVLQAPIGYLNTRMIQDVLADGTVALTPEDERGLNPLFWSNIAPYGEVKLDFGRRITLTADARPATPPARTSTPTMPKALPMTHTDDTCTGGPAPRSARRSNRPPQQSPPTTSAWPPPPCNACFSTPNTPAQLSSAMHSPPERIGGSSASTSACTRKPPTNSTAVLWRACCHRRGNGHNSPWSAPRAYFPSTTKTRNTVPTWTTLAPSTVSPRIRRCAASGTEAEQLGEQVWITVRLPGTYEGADNLEDGTANQRCTTVVIQPDQLGWLREALQFLADGEQEC
jgi:hypothetical protein